MILLVTTSSRAKECAAALDRGTGHKTYVATSVPQAISKLQAAEYDGLAIDQSLLEADFRALDTLLNHAGMAMPLYVNLALHSSERVVREVQVALRRADKEKVVAMRAAGQVLRNQLCGEVDRNPAELRTGAAAEVAFARHCGEDRVGAAAGRKNAFATGNCVSKNDPRAAGQRSTKDHVVRQRILWPTLG